MLSLPEKPWKRVKIEPAGGGRYRVVFVSPLESQAEFEVAILEDLEPCLREGDSLGDANWETKSVMVTTSDLHAFQRRLVFQGIMVEKEG